MASRDDVERFRAEHPELCKAVAKEAWDEIEELGKQLVATAKDAVRAERVRCGALVTLATKHNASPDALRAAIVEGTTLEDFLHSLGGPQPSPEELN